uniref:HhH-GPD domain-containing protein n=1 Tax=Pseudo-nitzschia australis TaxID=44445 RepID=A0A7S4AMS8_9STRA
MASKTTTTSTSTKTDESSNRCISRFFRPKPNPIRYEENLLRAEKATNIIVLDSDDDDENDNSCCNNNSSIDIVNDYKQGIDMPETDLAQDESELTANSIIEIDDDERDEVCIDVVQKEETESSNTSIAKNEDGCSDHNNPSLKPSDPGVVDANEDTTNQQKVASQQKISVVVESNKENPFARFACDVYGTSESHAGRITGCASRSHKRTSNNSIENNGMNYDRCSKKIRTRTPSKQGKKKEKEFVKIEHISPEEQSKIVRKWHSMADPSAPLEIRRYQVLLAARLHARCQEKTVRKAMRSLRDYFSSLPEPKMVTVVEMANIEPELLAGHVSNVQFFNVKARQIVKAAGELLERHRGIVPEDEFSLLQITGIGKTFADLLAFVNTREAHERFGKLT